MSAEEKAKLQHLENVMIGISKEFQKRKLNNLTIKKAQAVLNCPRLCRQYKKGSLR